MKTESEKVRGEVSKAYSEAVKKTGASCCGVERKGAVVDLAGYGDDQLNSLPKDAVVNSFGCGNPVALAGLKPGQVVLDLGSGAGIDILLAAQKVGAGGHVIGIDMTDEMIKKARENIKASGLANAEVRKGIIEDLPVESGTVDWVISNCVINLSPEKKKVFSEIARVLKPGGKMSVSDMVAEDLPEWIRANANMYSSCISGAISEKEYLAGLRDAGLTNVKVVDRLVYEASQMVALVDTELPTSCGCGTVLDAGQIEKLAKEVEGKIWSAKIYAEKPV